VDGRWPNWFLVVVANGMQLLDFFFKKNEQRRARWRFGHGYAKPSEINPDIDRPHLHEDEDVDGG